MWFPSVPDRVLLTLFQYFDLLASANLFVTFDFCVSALTGMYMTIPAVLICFTIHPAG